MRVGTMVISEGLVLSVKIISREILNGLQSDLGILDFLLFRMKDEALKRLPRRRENNDKLSRTFVMAAFHSAVSGLVVGRTSSDLIILSLMKARSSGGVGMHRMRIPRGIETKPRANKIPHSRPGIRVTWKAAPPMNTMRT